MRDTVNNTRHIYVTSASIAIWAIAFALLAIGCVAMLLGWFPFSDKDLSGVERIALIVGIAFGALGCFSLSAKVLMPKPYISLDADGMTWKMPMPFAISQTAHWRDVSDVHYEIDKGTEGEGRLIRIITKDGKKHKILLMWGMVCDGEKLSAEEVFDWMHQFHKGSRAR